MGNIFTESQEQRDIELAEFCKVPVGTVKNYPIGTQASVQLFKNEDIALQSYDFIYKNYKYVERVNWLRTCSALTITRRSKYILELVTKIGKLEQQHVLDYGCGVGSHGIFCAELGATVDFLDVDGPLFDYAKWRIAKRNLKVGKYLYPESKLTAAHYDAILCLDVLEHVADPAGTLSNIACALKTNGYLLLEVSTIVKPTSGHFSQSIERWKKHGAVVLRNKFFRISKNLFYKK
jgi:2-polyprenyl-3-methyl-5-hydroxy-6-metoxy-1,4-benzoquinol methylase